MQIEFSTFSKIFRLSTRELYLARTREWNMAIKWPHLMVALEAATIKGKAAKSLDLTGLGYRE